MLFITNRFPKQSIRSRIGRRFDFDLNNNAASNSIFFCARNNQDRHTKIGSLELLKRLKETACRQLIIHIHGFSNLSETVFGGAKEFQKLCDDAKKNESLEKGKQGELICHASQNVVVYHASDDLAPRAGKVSNLKNKIASRRLGHTGPEDMGLIPKNVFSVDCDDVNNAYDLKGHSYFRSGRVAGEPGLVFDHIFQTLLSSRVFPEDEFRRTAIIREK